MKNLKKTVAAGVIGVTILAGTAGTFATWQHSDAVQAGTINTGDLSVTLRTVGTWTSDMNGRRYPSLSDVIFVPGEQVRTPLRGQVEATGLTLNDVTLTSSTRGDLAINEAGYLLREDGTPSQLRFELRQWFYTNGNQPAWMGQDNVQIQLIVALDRAAELGMYENGIENFDLGEITATVTQR